MAVSSGAMPCPPPLSPSPSTAGASPVSTPHRSCRAQRNRSPFAPPRSPSPRSPQLSHAASPPPWTARSAPTGFGPATALARWTYGAWFARSIMRVWGLVNAELNTRAYIHMAGNYFLLRFLLIKGFEGRKQNQQLDKYELPPLLLVFGACLCGKRCLFLKPTYVLSRTRGVLSHWIDHCGWRATQPWCIWISFVLNVVCLDAVSI